MAEVGVREDPCDDEAERQRHDDEHGLREPERCIAHVVEPEVVDAPIEEQSRDHDDDRGDRQGDAGVACLPEHQRREEPGGRGTNESSDAGGDAGEVQKLKAQRVRDHADEAGDGGHFGRRVEHHGETEDADEACKKA